MKKVLLAASIASALSLFNVAQAASDSGTITFNGEITDQTCDVKVNGSVSPTVTLPTVTKTSVNATGRTGTTKFTFEIKDCDTTAAFKIQPYFVANGTYMDFTDNTLTNQLTPGAGVATNVALELLFPDGATKVPLGETVGTGAYTSNITAIGAGDALSDTTALNLSYFVQYYSAGSNATAGLIQGKVDYVMAYQ